LSVISSACQPAPPTYWDEGGAVLQIPDAVLLRHGEEPIRLHSDGRVTRGDEVLYFIDRAGRVTDEDYESLALLTPSGHLAGNDDFYWGRVGLRNASPPWSALAWLRLSQSGALLLFDVAGEPYHKGQWEGCNGASIRACTLVSHLLTLSAARRYDADRVQFGLGVGVWY
jgi:hypothetical protein